MVKLETTNIIPILIHKITKHKISGDPVKYECISGIQIDRKQRDCYNRIECELTCACSGGDVHINYL